MPDSPAFIQRHSRSVHFAGGLLLGILLGPILHHFYVSEDPALTPAQIEAQRVELESAEDAIAATLSAMPTIAAADIHIAPAEHPDRWHSREATVVLTLVDAPLSDDQISDVSSLVARMAPGVGEADVVLLDAAGESINSEFLQLTQRRHYWTNIAINVAFVLGVIAIILIVQFLLKAITGRAG